jgi:hypothetical protein
MPTSFAAALSLQAKKLLLEVMAFHIPSNSPQSVRPSLPRELLLFFFKV